MASFTGTYDRHGWQRRETHPQVKTKMASFTGTYKDELIATANAPSRRRAAGGHPRKP